jgi:MFS transporter, AAHS family, 4-hydroxybenzoate transporter
MTTSSVSIEGRPQDRCEWGVFAICTAIALLDGFDVQTMGVAAPALARAWGVPPPALSPVFMAAPAGMLVGALAMGHLADRMGRRLPIIAATLLFAVGTSLTPFAPSLTAMAALRFVTGIGLGGVLPNLVSLVTEFAPPRLRATLTTLTFSSLPLGSMLAALLARYLIPVYGWPSLFYLGGVAPAAIAAVAFLRLPEYVCRNRRAFLPGDACRRSGKHLAPPRSCASSGPAARGRPRFSFSSLRSTCSCCISR